MIAEVIAIGDELTTGQRLDTNTRWLSERLTALGLRVLFQTTVADDLDANQRVFRAAIERADVIVATGGLGPTADDLTRDVLAATLNVELEQDDQALAHIEHLFARRGRKMPPRNRLQALLPRGTRQIFNPHGTAPGIQATVERGNRTPCRLFALPGVPAEMFLMWDQSVAPAIAEILPVQRVTRHHLVKCFGAGESQIEAMLPDLIRRGRHPLVGITASSATITLRITAHAADEQACFASMEPTLAEIRQTLGKLVFGEADDELEHVVGRLLTTRGQTVATAEWMTAGRIAQWLSDVPESARFFAGGCVLADSSALESMLELTTPAAEPMAEQMRARAGVDFGLAVARVETSDQGVPGVTVALASSAGVHSKVLPVFGDPEFTKRHAAKVALNELRLRLLRSASP